MKGSKFDRFVILDVPATTFQVAFNDGKGNWDNNDGKNYIMENDGIWEISNKNTYYLSPSLSNIKEAQEKGLKDGGSTYFEALKEIRSGKKVN